ncbi:MAG: peptide chain release factor N(5)-glutamine methyltransferase [Shimia sp.]|uniref:peptide chain release factor N(5)-glutamine methyltransferase n=1 Tax=Shimia sp. TaxID=1954381 RepID=UPI001B1E3472|nr:peptide chain release factor N(5)-glutamine methyltransferase [Shimia sp.]MBO6899088.1 peptide chain release factor N(5)-glutamine methyltransferase [Shimia sp.]
MTGTIAALVKRAVEVLQDIPVNDPVKEARLLVSHATGLRPDRLTLELREEASPEQAEALEALLKRRQSREPVSHILGKRAFYNHEFIVTANTLDPRPETEILVSLALGIRFSKVLDMGTGTGAIILSVLAESPTAKGVATDLSPAALKVAEQNARALELSDRLTLLQSDWYSAIDGTFDLIVSNPPYIALDEMPSLAPELSFEPRMALTDEADGLTAYRKIAAGAPEHLNAGGWLMVEIGWQQGPEVAALFEDAGLISVAIKPDLDGRDRVVIGQKV